MAAKMFTPGEILKERRLKLNKSLEEVSQETKIQVRYLEQIENNEFEKFESDVFVSGFVKIYAQYLSLDVDKVLALYRRVSSEPKKDSKKNNKEKPNRNKNVNRLKGIFSPSNVIYAILAFTVIGIIAYLSFQFYDFQKPPKLELTSPEDGITTQESPITVNGTTEKGAIVKVNGVQIDINDNYTFETEVELVEGSNTITVKSSKSGQADKETVVVRNVKYLVYGAGSAGSEVETEPEPEPEVTSKTVRLVVAADAAWVQLYLDEQQEIANVVGPNFDEAYEIEESFLIVTGRPTVTEIYYNDVKQEIQIDSVQGIGRLSCSVNRNNLNCE